MLNVIRQIRSDWDSYCKLNKSNTILYFPLIFFHNPGMFFSLLYRAERSLIISNNILIKIIGIFFFPIYYVITYFILDFDIDPRVKIGDGLYLHNRGIIIAHTVEIGRNAHIIGPITIGTKSTDDNGTARIGNNVTIGTGARIIGNVIIGNDVVIGANAVVVKDIPNKKTAVGVPAKIID